MAYLQRFLSEDGQDGRDGRRYLQNAVRGKRVRYAYVREQAEIKK